MYLEFLGLKRESSYYERDLEQAIITHLQDFLIYLSLKEMYIPVNNVNEVRFSKNAFLAMKYPMLF